jgi:uncharacterized GH25 family protein
MTSPRAVAALLLLFAGSAGAHDTWLLPETFSVAPGAELVFELTSGGEFPALDTAIEPERVARAAYVSRDRSSTSACSLRPSIRCA